MVEEELKTAYKLFQKPDNLQSLSVVSAYRSLSFLWQARLAQVFPKTEKNSEKLSLQALEQARKALEFAEKKIEAEYPYPADFIRAYWMLGEALMLCGRSNSGKSSKGFEIHFYEEHFQERGPSEEVAPGKEWQAAERCLNEALRRCRKINLVEIEADLLVAQARLVWARTDQAEKDGSFDEIAAHLQEAHQVAERAGYWLQLADIHLFCGEVLLETGKDSSGPSVELLGFSAREHLQKAKAYALDVSEFSDLYQSDDPQFYEGIPEYEMLKRGLSDQERIENGYWVAWQIADALEKRLDG